MLIMGSARANWHPRSYYIQPHYATMPEYLRIEDAGVLKITGARRKFWTQCRDAGLREWSALGIELRVRRSVQPYRPQRVTLNLADPKNGLGGGHWFEDPEYCIPGQAVDWVHIDPVKFEQIYLSNVRQPLVYLFAHEFGHSLGFGHGGDGVMDETPEHAVVNDEELEAARAYWFPA